jgi:hypothetical protein
MKEEIKSTRSADYYNVAQSDVRALVRGELTTLKRRWQAKKSCRHRDQIPLCGLY